MNRAHLTFSQSADSRDSKSWASGQDGMAPIDAKRHTFEFRRINCQGVIMSLRDPKKTCHSTDNNIPQQNDMNGCSSELWLYLPLGDCNLNLQFRKQTWHLLPMDCEKQSTPDQLFQTEVCKYGNEVSDLHKHKCWVAKHECWIIYDHSQPQFNDYNEGILLIKTLIPEQFKSDYSHPSDKWPTVMTSWKQSQLILGLPESLIILSKQTQECEMEHEAC